MLFGTETKLFKTGKCVSYKRQCEFFGVCDISVPLEYAPVEMKADEGFHFIKYQDLFDFVREKVHAITR